jgi:ubiquinone/menaquinone biosynthesis C-methylase UbiE
MGIRRSLRALLKKKSGPGRWLGDLYLTLHPVHLKEIFIGTSAREKQWAARHLRRGNDWGNTGHAGSPDEWVLSYWDSRQHPHRRFLVDKVAAYYPFSNILEIGCNCAPNLYLLAKQFPDAKITGIDINPRAIEKGREMLAAEGITNVRLLVAKADELGQFADDSFDVVFTDATLIYIGPDKINRVFEHLMRITRKALVLMEMQPGWKKKTETGVHQLGLWVRDYAALLSKYIPADRIRVSPVTREMWPDPEWLEAGAITEANLAGADKRLKQEIPRQAGMDVIIVCHTEIEDLARKIASGADYRAEVATSASRLIEIADKYGARVTFAVCPEIAEYMPAQIKHEIGLHVHPGDTRYKQVSSGWYAGDMYLKEHSRQSVDSSSLRNYPYADQLDMIITGKKYLEDVFHVPVKTFVAGRWSVNNDTVKALLAAGITHDCSASTHKKAGHYDWLELPRICLPYHPAQESYQVKGNLPLLELPISQSWLAGDVNPENTPIIGLPWLKACFLEYYQQKLPLFHVCLHSTAMADPYLVSMMDEFLKFISKHRSVSFKFASEIQAYRQIKPETRAMPYLLHGVNAALIKSFIKMKIFRQK